MARKTLVSKVKELVTGREVKQGFASFREEAVSTWRDAVRRHVAGEAIDLADLFRVGPNLGIPTSKISGVFASDCEIWTQYEDHLKNVADNEAAAKEADKAAIGATEEVQRLAEALEEAVRRRDAPGWTYQALAFARQSFLPTIRQNPRLFLEQAQEIPAEVEELDTSDEIATSFETVPPSDDGEAFWTSDED
jgi:hypothetical protein